MLAGCATPGPPQPPSLALPQHVADLEARRQGNRVLLTWSPPSQTTDKLRIRAAGATAVCEQIEPDFAAATSASSNSSMQQCSPIVATVPPADLHAAGGSPAPAQRSANPSQAQRVTYAVEIPPELGRKYPDGAAVFYVEALNPQGRGAGFSNPAAVPLAPAFEPPAGLAAAATKNAIQLTWTPIQAPAVDRVRLTGYRIERSEGGAQMPDEHLLVKAGTPSDGHVADTQFAWGKQYQYRIAALTGVFAADGRQVAEVQGEWSQPVAITARDVFPPSQPSGLQAVFTQVGAQGYIDLTWLPNIDPDLAGYVVYRRSESGAPERLNSELVKAPAFRDTAVVPGTRYSYSVSAVDVRGNEGPRSQEASELVPKP